jgi:CelD/BcsL family acetyltransferase involved in cellulose biosynthesis
MASLSISILEGNSALESIAAEWDQAVPESFTAALTRSSWYLAWQQSFPPKQIVGVTARQDGRLVGLLPMSLVKTDARGLYFCQATNFARGDYQPPIIASGAGPDVLPALLDAALDYFGRRIVYWFANIPETDSSARILPSHLSSRGLVVAEQVQTAPRLSIAGRTYAEIESTWSPSHRTDVRRQRKRLAALGKLSLWQPQNSNDAHELLEELFVVHDEKWLSQGQPGRFHDPAERRHFSAIVDRMWGNGLHLSALKSGETNVSYGFGFFSNNWIQWYRPTYRTDYHNYSPGKVHIALLLEEACQKQWQGFDFLTGPEPYKLQWTNETMRVMDYYASFSSSLPAFQWFTRGKPYVRDRLGPMYAQLQARLKKNSLLTHLFSRK